MTTEVQHSDITHHYLRAKKKFPNVWCAGCGNGIVMGALIRAIDKLGLDKDNVAIVPVSAAPAACRYIWISIPCTRLMDAPWPLPPA